MMGRSGCGTQLRAEKPAASPRTRAEFLRSLFPRDGRVLAAAGYDKATGTFLLHLWDPATGREIRQIQQEDFVYQVTSLAFSPDGKTLAGAMQGTEKGQAKFI